MSEIDNKTELDTMMICKGWHDEKTTFDAFKKYYKKYYSDDITLTYALCIKVFIRPTIEYILTRENAPIRSFVNSGLFSRSIYEFATVYGNLTFNETMFNRMSEWIYGLQVVVNDIDVYGLKEYKKEREKEL